MAIHKSVSLPKESALHMEVAIHKSVYMCNADSLGRETLGEGYLR